MKINVEVNKMGNLIINGKKKFCPFINVPDNARDDDGPFCGDWCALFFEPVCNPTDKFVFLNLCRGYWKCKKEEFIDEREGGIKLTFQIRNEKTV